MARRMNAGGLALVTTLLLLVVGCDLNNNPGVITQIITPTQVITNTVAPIWTSTLKVTATLIPTSTFTTAPTSSPSETPAPITDTPIAQSTLRVSFNGTVTLKQATANLRAGPGTNFDIVQKIKAGTSVAVLGMNDSKDWYFVRLLDATTGWVGKDFLAVSTTALPVLQTPDLTQIAQETPAPIPTIAPSVAAHDPRITDILAYCDAPDFKDRPRTFRSNAALNVYWEWEAQTPEQVKDQIDNGQYEVSLDDKLIENWSAYRTDVRKVIIKLHTVWQVYWYIPVGKLDVGPHKISYKLTWKQKISDGTTTYGPGGDQESNTGTCTFTVTK